MFDMIIWHGRRRLALGGISSGLRIRTWRVPGNGHGWREMIPIVRR